MVDRDKSASFESLMMPHFEAVYRLARGLAGETEGRDLAQESFLRAWRYFHTFRPGTNAKAWLLQIVRHAFFDRRRASPPLECWDESNEAHQPAFDLEREVTREELSPCLMQALGVLSADARACLLLAEVEELSYAEIAEVLGCPIGTVMSRLSRARAAFRLALGALMKSPPARKEG